VFLDALRREHNVEVIDVKRQNLSRARSVRRMYEAVSFAWRARKASRRCSACYITIAQSVAGNLRDLLIYFATYRLRAKTIVHLHGGMGMSVLLSTRHPLLRRLNAFFLRRFAAVVVLGERQVPILAPFVSPERIHIVPNFAQDNLFVGTDAIHAKFSAANPLRLLFLSNFNPGKGHRELLEAIMLLRPDTLARVHVDFAGGFESDADRQEFLKAAGAFPGVHYHGVAEGAAKERLLASAHIFCLPTYYAFEGQPISLLEAYAAGCGVITTDHGGILDVFAPGENGYLVEKRSAASIAAAVERAVANPAETLFFAQNNHEQALRRYRVGTFNGNLLRIVCRLVDPVPAVDAEAEIGVRPRDDLCNMDSRDKVGS
jgi:glycosyltransferase involved in cell wall biosynthesis